MTETSNQTGPDGVEPKFPRLADAVRRIGLLRWPIGIAGAVFAGLWLLTGLGPLAALLGFAAIAAAVIAVCGADPRPPGPGRPVEKIARDPLAGYTAVAEGLPDACFLIDAAGNVRFENTAARKLFGGPLADQPAGQPISFILRAPEVGEAITQALSTGTAASVTFFERVPADRWFEARVSPLGDAGQTPGQTPGEPPGQTPIYLVLLRDLTEAQRVERMRVDFVANASHELRTPLASVSGFIETLQGPARNDPDARERFLQIMAEQARRMSRLIDDLMSLSRIELKAHVRPETVVDVAPTLEHVADSMHPLSIESGVELTLDIRDRPLPVVGDRDELAQVFQNLVHNAIKYGQAGGRVDVTAELDSRGPGKPAHVSVTVRDYGQGIPAEHLPRLTERFYRVDNATSREKGGTGLGLAIVKHILNRHRGHLAIDSKPGEGAEFRVLLDSVDSVAEIHNPHAGGKIT